MRKPAQPEPHHDDPQPKDNRAPAAYMRKAKEDARYHPPEFGLHRAPK